MQMEFYCSGLKVGRPPDYTDGPTVTTRVFKRRGKRAREKYDHIQVTVMQRDGSIAVFSLKDGGREPATGSFWKLEKSGKWILP